MYGYSQKGRSTVAPNMIKNVINGQQSIWIQNPRQWFWLYHLLAVQSWIKHLFLSPLHFKGIVLMEGWRLEKNQGRSQWTYCLPIAWVSMVCTIEDCSGENTEREVRWEMFFHKLGPLDYEWQKNQPQFALIKKEYRYYRFISSPLDLVLASGKWIQALIVFGFLQSLGSQFCHAGFSLGLYVVAIGSSRPSPYKLSNLSSG